MNKTVIDFIEFQAYHHPGDIAYRFLYDDEGKEALLTYAELRAKAQTLAKLLKEKIPGTATAVLLYTPGPSFIIAFIACLYAGILAIPTYPPIPRRLTLNIIRLEKLCKDANPAIILADTASARLLNSALLKENCKGFLDKLLNLGLSVQEGLKLNKIPIFVTEGIEASYEDDFIPLVKDSKQIAYIQYSSGSTGHPKGILVTHENLLSNIAEILKVTGAHPQTTSLSWLPHYHDMGLIGFTLTYLINKLPIIQLSPFTFLQNPLFWLNAISRYKATVTGCPNFGLELCIRAINAHPEQNMDLSSLELFLCGAEPINSELPERFYEAFKPYGLKQSAFFPVYGLAEHTLMVSGGKKGDQAKVKNFDTGKLRKHEVAELSTEEAGTRIVSCGKVIDNHEICIVDSNSLEPLNQDRVGEIWLKGPSVTKGYLNQIETTRESYEAYRNDGEGPYLRTNDVGFLHNNELYIFGRLKDVITIQGNKYAPQDIEFSAQMANDRVRKGNIAAFVVYINNYEHLVIVSEISDQATKGHHTEIMTSIRKAVARDFNLSMLEVVLIKPRTIPKTTSGKIQRNATKTAYLDNELEIIASWKCPTTPSPQPVSAIA